MGKNISNQYIRVLADSVGKSILEGNSEAIQKLKPILDTKCPFSKLDLLGREIGQFGRSQQQKFFKAFDEIIDHNAMGGFVIVGQALIHFLERNFENVMRKSRGYIIRGDVWYVCDIIGERSLGQALVSYFEKTLPWLENFLRDENRWVRRSVGVSIHYFSKRVLHEPEKTKRLLKLVEPYIGEKQIDVVKGIGWGLKTIGKYHPDILIEFLDRQVRAKKRLSRSMMEKAVTYLDRDRKKEMEKLVKIACSRG